MKKIIKWRILIITSAVCILPIILGIALRDRLPCSIAIHFDLNNNPDNFVSKGFSVFGLPLLMVLLQIVCCVINDVNAKKFGERKKFETATKWIIPCMTLLLQGVTFMYALNIPVDIRKSAITIVGGVFLVIGNYMPKLDYIKNHSINKEKSRKINRFIGFESVIMGILALITVFLPPIASLIWLFMLIPYTALSVIYSAAVIRKQ